MVDHDALTTAVTEACALDPAYAGPSTNFLLRPPGFGLTMPARNRIGRALMDHSNAADLFGLLMPYGDGTAEGFDPDTAAAWLIWEANRRPASEVVADFAHFFDHRKVKGLKIEFLHGLQITTSINLGASLRLEPFATLPASCQKSVFAQTAEFERHDLGRLGDPVALTIRFPISPGLADPAIQAPRRLTLKVISCPASGISKASKAVRRSFAAASAV